MSKPLVSVIIPVYNVEPFLAQCLDSVCHQTYKNLEIICINDGSTDRSLDILNEFSQHDSQLIVINNENHGVSFSRNQGLSMAHGEWIMFVDADDWLDLDCVEKCLSIALDTQPDIVMFPYYSEHSSGTIERRLFTQDRIFTEKSLQDLARRMIGPIGEEIVEPNKLDSYGTIWGKVYRLEIIKDLRFIDLSIIGTAEDSLFNMHAFKKAQKIYYTNSIHYHYRRNNTSSITAHYKSNLLELWKHQYQIIAANFSESDEKKALQNRIALNVLGACMNVQHTHSPIKAIRNILNDRLYHPALKQLVLSHFPFYWQFFFFSSKLKFSTIVYALLFCIQIIRNRTQHQ